MCKTDMIPELIRMCSAKAAQKRQALEQQPQGNGPSSLLRRLVPIAEGAAGALSLAARRRLHSCQAL